MRQAWWSFPIAGAAANSAPRSRWTSTTPHRPDTHDANPNTGFAVFDSFGSGGWAQFGGTSVGAPQWAALIAIADQGRALAGKAPLSNAQSILYSLPSSDFHDVTTGGSKGLQAAAGYDLVSGLGSPIANLVIADLIAFNGLTALSLTVAGAAIAPNSVVGTRLEIAASESDARAGAPSISSAEIHSVARLASSVLQPFSAHSAAQSPIVLSSDAATVATDGAVAHRGRQTAADDNSSSADDASQAALKAFFAGLDSAAA
jgi:hypothetical protein